MEHNEAKFVTGGKGDCAPEVSATAPVGARHGDTPRAKKGKTGVRKMSQKW